MANIEELFGSSVFNDAVMQKRLPKDIYKALHKPSLMVRPLTRRWPTSWQMP